MGQLRIGTHTLATLMASSNALTAKDRDALSVRQLAADPQRRLSFTSTVMPDQTALNGTSKKSRLFILRNPLGKGAEGLTAVAYEPSQQRDVALKFLSSKSGPSNNLILDIQSQYVVRGFDYGVAEQYDGPILVMEQLKGKPLYELLHPSKEDSQSSSTILSIDQINSILLQTSLGLKDVFDGRIVHLDIKPENIMVNQDPIVKIKIFDFGIAQRFPYQNPFGLAVGTPQFMSPEAQSAGILTPSSDLFSFGMLMVDCFIDKSRTKTSNKPIYRNDVPYRLKKLAEECLRRKPEDRPNITDVITTLSNKSNLDYLWRKTTDRLKKRLAKNPNSKQDPT